MCLGAGSDWPHWVTHSEPLCYCSVPVSHFLAKCVSLVMSNDILLMNEIKALSTPLQLFWKTDIFLSMRKKEEETFEVVTV